MNLVPTDRAVAWHLWQAIDAWRPKARSAGLALPEEVEAFGLSCRLAARSGTEGHDGAEQAGMWSPPEEMPQLLFTYDETAAVLRLSERQVRHLVSQGELPVVAVGRSRRIHVDDVTAFAAGLRERSSCPTQPDNERSITA